MNNKENKCCSLRWLGIILCILGAITPILWTPILKYFIAKELYLNKKSKTYKNWESPPVPMHMDFYFFNWTNPDKINVEKPTFVEMGPYRYVEKRKKVNITFNTNGTVSYRVMRTWNFFPEQSCGPETDLVTTLNGIAVAGAHKVKEKGYMHQKSISFMMSVTKQGLSVTKPVRELLFEGYEDTLMTIGRSIPGASSSPYDKFGWFYGRNNSFKSDGFYNINTGARRIDQLGVLKRWNYGNRTKFFSGNCGDIRGSSGDQFPPGRSRDDSITLFSPDVCRHLTLLYAKDDEIEGVPVYKYEIDSNIFDNGTRVPGNKCFCNGECVPSGLLNITQCRYGVPAFISHPHFLNADPFYREEVIGMKPDPKKHTFYMSVEPTLGFPLEAAARIQVNLLMSQSKYVALFEDVPTVFMPVLWVEHKFRITPELATTLRLATSIPSKGYTVAAVMLFSGVAIIFCSLVCQKNKDLLEKQSDKEKEIPVVEFVSEKCKDIS